VKPSQYIIRQFYSPDDFAQTLWKHFRANGQKNIAIVKLKLLYYDKITESLKKLAQTGETVTVVDEYQFGDNDFRTSLAKINALPAKPDTLGVFLAGGQIAQFYRQADTLGVTFPTFGADFFESYSEIADAEGLMDGAVYANIGVTDEFVKKYEAEFGNVNQVSFAGQSYDFVKMLRDEVDFTNADSIIKSIHTIKSFDGILGSYTYSGSGGDQYLKSPVYIKEITGNTITTLR
jgi:ABC-type branched-subunit amino acid transport system substrate-binding protein